MAIDLDQRRAEFIHELAIFLCEDQAGKSVQLQCGSKSARAWMRLRNATPLFGWLTVEEAEERLTKFLWPHD